MLLINGNTNIFAIHIFGLNVSVHPWHSDGRLHTAAMADFNEKPNWCFFSVPIQYSLYFLGLSYILTWKIVKCSLLFVPVYVVWNNKIE